MLKWSNHGTTTLGIYFESDVIVNPSPEPNFHHGRYCHKHLISLSQMCHKSQCVIGTGFPAIVLLSGCCCIEGRGGILFLLLIDCMQSHISGIQVYSDIQATYQAKFTGGRG